MTAMIFGMACRFREKLSNWFGSRESLCWSRSDNFTAVGKCKNKIPKICSCASQSEPRHIIEQPQKPPPSYLAIINNHSMMKTSGI